VGGTPLALVTADLEAHVVVVDVSTGRVVGRVPTDPGPRSIESVSSTTAVIAHTTHGKVSLLDGPSLHVRTRIDGFGAPRYTAADPRGRYAYVTDSTLGDVAVVDLLRREVVDRLALDGPARHVTASPDGRRLWVALGSTAHELAVVDVARPAQLRLLARVRPPFLAHDVGFTPAGKSVWVTSGDRGSIAAYDARTGGVRFRIDADAAPQHVTFSGGRAYVASGDAGTLRVHDLDGRLVRTTRIPVGSYNVQYAWDDVVLTPSLSRGTLCVLRRGGRVEHELAVARSSHDACFVVGR
jgi:DNA-binding beta-propeller fold protein YncE